MDLNNILNAGIENLISEQQTNQLGNLTGSNALLFNVKISAFEAESNSHCPRVALLRREANVQEPTSQQSFLSNTHGRLFEDLLRSILLNSGVNGLEYLEEEEAEIRITDLDGTEILTARPDKILKLYDKILPVEVKTIQSANTAHSVFIENKPKLGALIQLSIYMYGHKVDEGYLLYAASNWFSGYNFSNRQKWTINPSIKLFHCELKNNKVYFEGKESLVTIDKILQGVSAYEFHKKINVLPDRPLWKDVYGDPAKFDGCFYCKFNPVCTRYDNLQKIELKEFFNDCRKEIEI